MSPFRHASVAIACLIASSCIPLRFSGYEPSGPGTLEPGYCIAWIRDNLRIDGPHSVSIRLRAYPYQTEGTLLLSIDVTVPADVSASFVSPYVTLDSPQWEGSKTLTIEAITTGGPRSVGPTDVLRSAAVGSSETFGVWFRPVGKGALDWTGLPLVDTFTLKLPAMQINGDAFQVEPVTFRAYRKWGMYYCVQ